MTRPIARVAEIVAEFGPFTGVDRVHGLTFDGTHVWFGAGDTVLAVDPAGGEVQRSIRVAATAGTAFDGRHLYQIGGDRIRRIDLKTGRVLDSIPAPEGAPASGLAWAEGSLWVGQHEARRIHQVDPKTGAILRTIESNRFVTGVTWADGELWHGAWESGDAHHLCEGDQQAGASELRRVDAETGEVLETLKMPSGVAVSGLEFDGGDRFFCGGGASGKILAVRRPGRRTRTETAAASADR